MSRSDNTTAVILAFAVALVTAFSYTELVTKNPHAAGAALYTHKALGIHFVTFLVAFAVLSSGITSAATASNVFASNLVAGSGWDLPGTEVMWIALGFLALVAAINLRGAGESVWFNVRSITTTSSTEVSSVARVRHLCVPHGAVGPSGGPHPVSDRAGSDQHRSHPLGGDMAVEPLHQGLQHQIPPPGGTDVN